MELKSSSARVKQLVIASAICLLAGFTPMKSGAEQAPAAGGTPPGQAAEVPAAAPEAAAAPAPEEKGDAATGQALFTGGKSFTNGAAPCISCHSAGVGALGGGSLGPDLTKAFVDDTKNPLLSTVWVNGGGSPTMGPIYSAKNITDDEMGHIRAFLKAQGKQEVASSSTGAFAGLGIAGCVGMLVLFGIIWGGRYSKRTANTAHDALWRNYGGKGKS